MTTPAPPDPSTVDTSTVDRSTVDLSVVDPGGLDALPVALAAAGPAAGRIRRLVEGELGWQPVDGGPARVLVADVAGAAGADAGGGPSVLLVAADDDPQVAAEAVRRLRPTEILGWPPRGRDHLRDAVAAALRDHAPLGAARTAPLVTVGGASGGVGTTTVALALAGLHAWEGADVVAVVGGSVPHPTRPGVAPTALGSPSLDAALQPARGVPRLRILRVVGDRSAVQALPPRTTVVDRGVAIAVDVLVCRRDAAALEALATSPARVVLATDSGAVPWAALRRAAGRRHVVLLPWSARVARAGALGRVPASLPGAWLARLRPLVDAGPPRG